MTKLATKFLHLMCELCVYIAEHVTTLVRACLHRCFCDMDLSGTRMLCRPWSLSSRGTNNNISECEAVKLPDPYDKKEIDLLHVWTL